MPAYLALLTVLLAAYTPLLTLAVPAARVRRHSLEEINQ